MRISDWSSDVCSSDLDRDVRWLRALRNRLSHENRNDPELTIEDQWLRRDLWEERARRAVAIAFAALYLEAGGSREDRKSVVKGKSVSVRVDLGGRRIIKKKKSIDCQCLQLVIVVVTL